MWTRPARGASLFVVSLVGVAALLAWSDAEAASRVKRFQSVRLANPGILYFGNGDDCRIHAGPILEDSTSALNLRDPAVRIAAPDPFKSPSQLLFGPTEGCAILLDPNGPSGLQFRDPSGVRIVNPVDGRLAVLNFGGGEGCSISASPSVGLRLADPTGIALLADTTVEGTVTATRFATMSSRSLKEGIAPIKDPLDTIQRLRGVSFRWRDKYGGGKDLGFVAEEVAPVLPEVVQFSADGATPRGIRYSSMVAVTVEAIKGQQEQIQVLQQQNQDLQARIAALEARVVKLCQSLETGAGK